MGNEMNAKDVYSKKTWSVISFKAKVLMSGSSNKNQGQHLADPVIDQCEREESCFISFLLFNQIFIFEQLRLFFICK